ncbi:hypothetical protein C0993_004649, partial [Termitomyces sp. T159_Od127]
PVRVGCINYVTDPTGASDLKVQIAIGGSGIGQPNQSPATVKVKYLLASSVGDINITTITRDGTMNLCTVPVPAPSYALIYLTDTSLNEPGGAATQTFATTEHRDGGPGCARDVEWGVWEEVGEHEFWE